MTSEIDQSGGRGGPGRPRLGERGELEGKLPVAVLEALRKAAK
ncbi:MAG TPA: hypothetical protein VNM90_05680 [Haliangium sp.]|nr:hypothetical protein [Haliangium sp.]